MITFVVSSTVSEIRRLIGRKSPIRTHPTSFNALARGDPLRILGWTWYPQKLEWRGYHAVKKWWSYVAVSGSIRFMPIFAGVRWRGGVKWEWGRLKWRFSLHSFTVFGTFYMHGHTTAFRWYDCQWRWAYFKVIGATFEWPWSTFEGHLSLGCHFRVHFSNPFHVFASHFLPLSAIAELLVCLRENVNFYQSGSIASYASAGIASHPITVMSVRLSVCLSVRRMSVTLWHCVFSWAVY